MHCQLIVLAPAEGVPACPCGAGVCSPVQGARLALWQGCPGFLEAVTSGRRDPSPRVGAGGASFTRVWAPKEPHQPHPPVEAHLLVLSRRHTGHCVPTPAIWGRRLQAQGSGKLAGTASSSRSRPDAHILGPLTQGTMGMLPGPPMATPSLLLPSPRVASLSPLCGSQQDVRNARPVHSQDDDC